MQRGCESDGNFGRPGGKTVLSITPPPHLPPISSPPFPSLTAACQNVLHIPLTLNKADCLTKIKNKKNIIVGVAFLEQAAFRVV